MPAKFDATDIRLAEIFKAELPYRIPQYQRPYTWGDDQVLDYWEDICGKEDADFIGSLIFNYEYEKSEKCIDVIDGQQRLLTTTIFVAAVRDHLASLGGAGLDTARLFQNHYIAFKSRRGLETYKIQTADTLKAFFEKHVQNYPGGMLDTSGQFAAKSKYQEPKRVIRTYQLFREKVVAHLNQASSVEGKVELAQKLMDQLDDITVIQIQIWSETEAYQIFETVNARGVDLSVADLLKNLLFKKIAVNEDADLKELSVKWNSVEETVRDASFEMAKFVRYFWLSKKNFLQEKHLFREIRNSTDDYVELLGHISAAAFDLWDLVCGDKGDWNSKDIKHPAKVFRALQGIRVMGVKQCYVLFLSILRNYPRLETDPQRVFALIENFSFVYSYVCNLPANRVERLYSKIARDIEQACLIDDKERRSRAVQTALHELVTKLVELWPSRDLFEEAFLDLAYGSTEKDRKVMKYVLGRFNDHGALGEHEINFEEVNIEHILPQKPAPEWGLTKQQIKGYVNLLGNLTLVSRRINSRAGNKTVEEKLKDLADSKLPITEQIVAELKKRSDGVNDSTPIWGEDSIRDRQRAMAREAFQKIWKP